MAGTHTENGMPIVKPETIEGILDKELEHASHYADLLMDTMARIKKENPALGHLISTVSISAGLMLSATGKIPLHSMSDIVTMMVSGMCMIYTAIENQEKEYKTE